MSQDSHNVSVLKYCIIHSENHIPVSSRIYIGTCILPNKKVMSGVTRWNLANSSAVFFQNLGSRLPCSCFGTS